MIREDSLGKQRIFLGNSDDAWPGLGEEDVGTRLFLQDRKGIVVWDGDQWTPASSGWIMLYTANPYAVRNSAGDASDATETTLHSFNIPPGIVYLSSCIRVKHFWGFTNSANQKNFNGRIAGTLFAAPSVTASNWSGQDNVMYLNGSLSTVVGINNGIEVGATANTPLSLAGADLAKAMAMTWNARWNVGSIVGEFIRLERVQVELFQ